MSDSSASDEPEAPKRKKKKKKAAYRSAAGGIAEIRAELERIGFRIVESFDDRIVAVRQKWHWDALATKLTYVVFVQQVGELEERDLDADEFQRRGKELDPSVLPRGFQKGTVVMPVFLARGVDPEVLDRVRRSPPMRFAFFFFPVVRDESTGQSGYFEGTPFWGGLYYAKFRWLAGRLVRPRDHGTGEPLSLAGVVLTVLVLGICALQIARLMGR